VEKGKLLEKTVVEVLVNFINEMDKNDWKYGLVLK
jgi:creatinine amidohydrolase